MEKTSLKLALLVFISLTVTSGMIPGAEAYGPFRCPHMIDCNKVCQGFPNRCVDGQCICDGGDPPIPTEPKSKFNKKWA
ncbi:hypothetical protein O6P43_025613 [Quillaja saponaria]|uniref:Uncharacterized protein n=1 Tax=Quillaja saponaria TaxID=32244 RepID=A0AAD7LA85_QUISA|nr:hypothetical protein O6P43_025613 [Quillaja saponaria]